MVENVTKKRFVCSLRSHPLFFVLQTEIPFFMKRLLISFLSFLLLGVKKFKWFDLLHPPFLFSLFRTFQTENPFLILVQRDCLLRHCRYLSELYFVITKKNANTLKIYIGKSLKRTKKKIFNMAARQSRSWYMRFLIKILSPFCCRPSPSQTNSFADLSTCNHILLHSRWKGSIGCMNLWQNKVQK